MSVGRVYRSSFNFRESRPNDWSVAAYKPTVTRHEDDDEEEGEDKMATALKVKSLDLNVANNTKNHQTDMYEITEDVKSENDDVPGKLVVRRGQEFTITMVFDRVIEKEDKLRLVLQTGEKPLVSKGTLVQLLPKDTLKSRNWSCSRQSQQDDRMTVAILSPPNCIVGTWRLSVETWIQDGEKKILDYMHEDPIYVIFNPFCKDDQVWMGDEVDIDEYILNDSGRIYSGSAGQITFKPWNFSQFESPVLECCMELLDKSKLNVQCRGDVVAVIRKISAIVNSCDDGGVLVGNWSGNYGDGTAPTHWTGSAPILKQYYETKEPVQYGQCWVFSGVSTTVCRALGIPTRSVTNFSSAHDCDGSITIDVHWNEKNEPIDSMNDDSVWNFHVWNEAWMTRPDLESGHRGWQAFDATPQETSGGLYCAGPVSVKAIKNGNVNMPYDGKFIFAEVNADKVHWIRAEDGSWKTVLQKNVVGRKISTNLPRLAKNSLWRGFMHRDEKTRMDLTDDYKHKEGTENERAVVMKANCHSTRSDIYIDQSTDVKFDFKQKDDVMVGNAFDVTIRAQNKSRKARSVHAVLTLKSEYYTGVTKKVVKKQVFDFEVPGIRTEEAVMRVSFDDYQHSFVDQIMFLMDLLATVTEIDDDKPIQVTPLQETYRLRRPDLTIEAPVSAKVGQPFNVVVKFASTMPIHLTSCKWMVDGPGLLRMSEKSHRDLDPYDSAEIKLTLTAKKSGNKKLTASFDTKELRDIAGSAEIIVD